MALAVVGGALLSALFDVLFDRLASPKLVNFIRGKKPDKLLQKMKSHLLVVRVVLADADKKQITDFNVKEWLDLLNDVVYEVDDLLDEVSTRAATQKEVSNSFSHLFNRKKIASISKLKDIVERLDDILKQKESLDLKENPVERNQPWKVILPATQTWRNRFVALSALSSRLRLLKNHPLNFSLRCLQM